MNQTADTTQTDELGALLAAATDVEDTFIRAAAVRAGLLWLCDCGFYNSGQTSTCEDCRVARARG